MKKQILLLVFAGLMQSLIAGSPGETTKLVQITDEEGQTAENKTPINWSKLCVKAFCLCIGAGLLGTGGYFFDKALTPGESEMFDPPDYPPCNPFERNHTKAKCVSTLPSQMWISVCGQLGGMVARTEQACIPGCSFNIHEDGAGVFSTGSRKETRLPEEELIRFQESQYDEYAYVICENKPDSWLHTLKSRLVNMSIPFWTTKTESGAKPRRKPPYREHIKYDTEGLVLPLEYASEAYNSVLYEKVLTHPFPIPCLGVYSVWCEPEGY